MLAGAGGTGTVRPDAPDPASLVSCYSVPLNSCCTLPAGSALPPGPSEALLSDSGASPGLSDWALTAPAVLAVAVSGLVWSPCWVASVSGLVGSDGAVRTAAGCGGLALAAALVP